MPAHPTACAVVSYLRNSKVERYQAPWAKSWLKNIICIPLSSQPTPLRIIFDKTRWPKYSISLLVLVLLSVEAKRESMSMVCRTAHQAWGQGAL